MGKIFKRHTGFSLDVLSQVVDGKSRRLGDPYVKRKLKTAFGEVTYGRGYVIKEKGSCGFHPLDVVLGADARRLFALGDPVRDAFGDPDELRGHARRVSELCRREGINPTQYYGWKKQLLSSAAKVFDSQEGKKSITAENLELKKGLSG